MKSPSPRMNDPRQEDLLARIEAEKARDVAMARAHRGADPEWVARARAVIMDIANGDYETFTTDDVWNYGLDKPREPRALGPVMIAMANEGLIESTGEYRKSTRRHAAAVVVWRKKQGGIIR